MNDVMIVFINQTAIILNKQWYNFYKERIQFEL